MKLSISNIAWDMEKDAMIYEYLREKSFEGIEIAPTRVFSENPYDRLDEAYSFSKKMADSYGLSISSMQSIWFGRSEIIFGSRDDRKALIDYTKKAICFAEVLGCNNLVFGCPKNRNINHKKEIQDIAIPFFREIGEYAQAHNTVLAIEANPIIYNTNFINYTKESFDLVSKINNKGIAVNVDLGTIIFNQEAISDIIDAIELVNHIHISEPNLDIIKKREIHKTLYGILKGKYNNYVSIEMGKRDRIKEIKMTVDYIKDIFLDI